MRSNNGVGDTPRIDDSETGALEDPKPVTPIGLLIPTLVSPDD